MKSKRTLSLSWMVLCGLFVRASALAFYNPITGRWRSVKD